jgi:5-methylcytosine-specific restriction endonuclease McrA
MENPPGTESVILRAEEIKQEIRTHEKQIQALKEERRKLKLPKITREEANHLYWEGNLPLALIMEAAGLKNSSKAQKAMIQPKEIAVVCGKCGERAHTIAASRARARELLVESKKKRHRCPECLKEQTEAQMNVFNAIREIRSAQFDRISELKAMPYPEYLKSPHWQTTRKQKLAHAHYSCELCSATNTRLNVHHKHYRTRGHENNRDLIALCEPCHAKFHDKLPGGDA